MVGVSSLSEDLLLVAECYNHAERLILYITHKILMNFAYFEIDVQIIAICISVRYRCFSSA